jgi:hypothetical protein
MCVYSRRRITYPLVLLKEDQEKQWRALDLTTSTTTKFVVCKTIHCYAVPPSKSVNLSAIRD